jgi:hypothetical protein
LNSDNDIAGLRQKHNQINPLLMKGDMGKWQKHTKGFGLKILLQVGFIVVLLAIIIIYFINYNNIL